MATPINMKAIDSARRLVANGNMLGAKALVQAAAFAPLSQAFGAIELAEQTLAQVDKADLAVVEALVEKAPDNVPGNQARGAWRFVKRNWPKDLGAVRVALAGAVAAFSEGALADAEKRIREVVDPASRALSDAYRAESLARRAQTWQRQGRSETLAWSSR